MAEPPAPAEGTLSTMQQDVLLKILEELKVRTTPPHCKEVPAASERMQWP